MRVINVMADGPIRSMLTEVQPELSAGAVPPPPINPEEWPDQLGRWVLRQAPTVTWEVWQPDPEIDRVVSHTFADGMVHRLFPAVEQRYYPGALRPVRGLYSAMLIEQLVATDERSCVIVLHGFGAPLWYALLAQLPQVPPCPVFVIGHGMAVTPLENLRVSRHPLSFPACLIEYLRARYLYRRLAGMAVQNAASLPAMRRIYRGRLETVTMGCDFTFWTPVPDEETKQVLRREIGLPPDRTVFLVAAHFRPLKQIDQLLRALYALQDRQDFTLLIVGQGDEGYTQALHELAAPLVAQGKVVWQPYVTGAALRRYYWAADICVSPSLTEGGPVAMMEAMACGLRALTTPVGSCYELLQRHGAATILPTVEHARWPALLRELLNTGGPPPLDREIARAAFDWPVVAARVVALVDDLSSRHDAQTAPETGVGKERRFPLRRRTRQVLGGTGER